MKHTIRLLTLVATLVAVIGLTGCPHPVNDNSDTHEHIWEETITKNPTCKDKGEKKLVCKICGEVEIEEIAKLPHSWVEDENDKCHYVCHNCGATKVQHTFVCGGCDEHGIYEFDDYQLEIEIYENNVSKNVKTSKGWFDNKIKIDTVYFSFNESNLLNYEEIEIVEVGTYWKTNEDGTTTLVSDINVNLNLKELLLRKTSYNITNINEDSDLVITIQKGQKKTVQVLVE